MERKTYQHAVKAALGRARTLRSEAFHEALATVGRWVSNSLHMTGHKAG